MEEFLGVRHFSCCYCWCCCCCCY